MGGEELSFVNDAFHENWIAPVGPNITGLEKDLTAYNDVKHAAALSTGTAAIHLALIMLGVKQGDEVLCATFTFAGSANPIIYQGAKPVYIDSEADTWNMCPDLLEKAIKDRMAKGQKPKAIILVHLYGMPAKIEALMAIAKTYEIPVIEDAAEALGASYQGKKLGTFGDIGIYSFNGNKIITTSGGGALVSDNLHYVEKAKHLATQARDPAPYYQHTEIGYNYRMSNIAAGIGRGQMLVLDEWVERRRTNHQAYKAALEGVGGLTFLDEPEGMYANRWLTTLLMPEENLGKYNPETLRQFLEEDNIESRPLWKPMHLQPVFAHCDSYLNGISEKCFQRGLCLPSGSGLGEANRNLVIDKVKRFFG